MRSDAHESLVGQIFGRLTVIEEIEKKGSHRYYLCKCSCGNFIYDCYRSIERK